MRCVSKLLTLVLWAGVWGVLSAGLSAAEQKETHQQPAVTQQLFASPEEAVRALQVAVETNDKAALCKLFGLEFPELLTGDEVLDAKHMQRFAAKLAQNCTQKKEGGDRITLEVGMENWPMPIPLVQANGQWYFDTVAGKEEVICRHIGKDELHAIGVCRAYVAAQRQYARVNSGGNRGVAYAQKFKSTPGKKDGLYWPTTENEPASPFGPLVAKAHAEGYGRNKDEGLHPFHGYYFRILTRQGKAAPGGEMDYMIDGNLVGGFALVAYPVLWDQSGIMTFIVNQDGKVFQCNLGKETSRIAGEMKEYNPDNKWTLVQDKGVLSTASGKSN